MRPMLAALSLCLPFLFAADAAQAQAKCKDGTPATITGTVGTVQQFRPEPGVNIWVMKASGKPSGNCSVEQIWGNGQAPAACTQGKKFSASGKALDADSFWMLQTEQITCN